MSPTPTPTAFASSSRDRPRRDRWPHCRARRPALDRIVVRWTRAAVPSDHVNPIHFKTVEQIHRVDRSLQAIPSDPDLLQVSAKIERASRRERVCQYVSNSVVDVTLKKKQT